MMFTLRNAWMAFFASRLTIVFGYDAYLTDVRFYFDVATSAIKNGQTAFTDFLWGYPPLSLSTVYLPYVLGFTEFDSYRTFYQLTNFVFEALTFYTLIKILSIRTKISTIEIAKSLVVYSVLGLFVGHTIYDRVDFFIVYSFTLAIYLAQKKTLDQSQIMAALGMLWKVIPVLWWTVYILLQLKIQGRRALRSTLTIGLLSGLFLIGWNQFTDGNMRTKLNLHSERGIQIESTWATPMMLAKSFNPNLDIKVENNHGGQHLGGRDLPKVYVMISKVVGFAILSSLFFWLALILKNRSKALEDTDTFNLAFYFTSLILISFLATQRVFSTTFIVWLLPILAIDLALKFGWLRLSLYSSIFILSYVGFDLGYFKYAAFDSFYIWVFAIRNLLVICLAAVFTRDTFTAVKGLSAKTKPVYSGNT